jgi:hypothetical protein
LTLPIHGVASAALSVPALRFLQTMGGASVKTAVLNSVGIVLVVAAFVMMCVALNTVS